MMKLINKIFRLLLLLPCFTMCMTAGCHSSADTQPKASILLPVASNVPDTSIIITIDSKKELKNKVDSTVIITKPESSNNQSQNLNSEQQFKDSLKIARPPPSKDSVVESVYNSQIGVREKTGHNDGVHVEKYLASVGLPKGNAWCAAFLHWCFSQANVKTTITAWAPTAENKSNLCYSNGVQKKQFQKADVFTLYFPSLKRIGHCGFVSGRFGLSSVETVEGNTNMAGSREGDGVYKKIRLKASLHSVSRWL